MDKTINELKNISKQYNIPFEISSSGEEIIGNYAAEWCKILELSEQNKQQLFKQWEVYYMTKVEAFVELLINGESIENAAYASGVVDMNTYDFLKALSKMDYKYLDIFANAVVGINGSINKVKELDNTLVDLNN